MLSTQSSLLDSNLSDLVNKLRPDEPPLAHSSPSVRINYDEDDNRRGQGEGEASASPPGKADGHVGQPVLLTPDSFLSSMRKVIFLLSYYILQVVVSSKTLPFSRHCTLSVYNTDLRGFL